MDVLSNHYSGRRLQNSEGYIVVNFGHDIYSFSESKILGHLRIHATSLCLHQGVKSNNVQKVIMEGNLTIGFRTRSNQDLIIKHDNHVRDDSYWS